MLMMILSSVFPYNSIPLSCFCVGFTSCFILIITFSCGSIGLLLGFVHFLIPCVYPICIPGCCSNSKAGCSVDWSPAPVDHMIKYLLGSWIQWSWVAQSCLRCNHSSISVHVNIRKCLGIGLYEGFCAWVNETSSKKALLVLSWVGKRFSTLVHLPFTVSPLSINRAHIFWFTRLACFRSLFCAFFVSFTGLLKQPKKGSLFLFVFCQPPCPAFMSSSLCWQFTLVGAYKHILWLSCHRNCHPMFGTFYHVY